MTDPHYADDAVTLYAGDCLDVLPTLPDSSVDAVVTDPPYGLEFMGKEWDKFKTYAGGNPNTKPKGPTIEAGEPERGNPWASERSSHGYRQKNPRCRRCGKLARGNGSCKCPEPQWDTRTAESANQFQYWCEAWAEQCLRVLRPGGHLLAFGGTRTWHRLAVAIEDAGFEIRDTIAWLYGSGFPKSLDVSKAIDKAAGTEREVLGERTYAGGHIQRSNGTDLGRLNDDGWSPTDGRLATAPATADAQRWQGWGTALKPAHEPVVVARKPLTGTVAANVLAHGTGALNVDGCRVGSEQRTSRGMSSLGVMHDDNWVPGDVTTTATGRWPANVALDETAAAALDHMSGDLDSGGPSRRDYAYDTGLKTDQIYGAMNRTTVKGHPGDGGASRFFYTAKAGSDERITHDGVSHPTVKPLSLMRWLVRLVCPPGGVVLDCFAGSGTTVEAALLEGFHCIAIEREPDYLPLITQRLNRRRDPLAYLTAAGEDLGLFGEPA